MEWFVLFALQLSPFLFFFSAETNMYAGLVPEEIRTVLKYFLENIIRDAVIYCEHSRRKTIGVGDVVCALKKNNRPLYGFGTFG
jgi:histone H3/H4